MEYVIERDGEWAVISRGLIHWTRSHNLASVFTNKQRAVKIAAARGGKVELSFGKAIPQGTKHFVAPKQSPINHRSAYRSI